MASLFFNIDSFVNSTNQEPIETTFVFSGDGEYSFHSTFLITFSFFKHKII